MPMGWESNTKYMAESAVFEVGNLHISMGWELNRLYKTLVTSIATLCIYIIYTSSYVEL